MMRESTVEAYFCAAVLAAGGMTRKLEWVGRPHAPDQLAVLPAVGVVLVELKRPGESARPGQEREHARLRAAGARVRVLSTFEQVDDFIAWAKSPKDHMSFRLEITEKNYCGGPRE